MKLEITHSGRRYLATVTCEKDCYVFEVVRCNSNYEWTEPYPFSRYSCSMECRLMHYKDFKVRIFENPNSSLKNFKEFKNV